MKTDLHVWEKIFVVNGTFHQAGDWHPGATPFYITWREALYPEVEADHCNERL